MRCDGCVNWLVYTSIKSCHTLKWKAKVTQLYLTVCNPMNYTVHGILRARILDWVAFPIFRGSSQPRDRTQASHITGRFTKCFTILIVNLASVKMKNVLKLFAEFINIKLDYHFPLWSVSNWERCIEIFYYSGRFIYLSLQFC